MKYGAIIFTDTANMGDDIQTYAASRFYPHLDYYIERENIDAFFSSDGEEVAAIMAGWYTHTPLNWPPSPYIRPLMVSMHFTPRMVCQFGSQRINVLDNKASLDWFEKSGEQGVGCRDSHTAKMLSELGVRTWWSGCITLTLRKFPDVEQHNKIVCVDVPDEQVEIVRQCTSREVVSVTHEYTVCEAYEKRMHCVEERLKFYQGASLIITTRLHAALPSVALGTPVIYCLNENTHDYRFGSYLKYLNCIDEDDLKRGRIVYDLDNPPANNPALLEIGERLAERCREFVSACERETCVGKIDFDAFYDMYNRTRRLKEMVYMETKDAYIQQYSVKGEDVHILFRHGMKEYEKRNWDRAAGYFGEAYEASGGRSKTMQVEILDKYIRCLANAGNPAGAKLVLNAGRETYGTVEKYQKLYEEFMNS